MDRFKILDSRGRNARTQGSGLCSWVCGDGGGPGEEHVGGRVGEQEIQSFGHTKLEMSVIHTVLIM